MDRRSLITRGLATVVAVGAAPAAFAVPAANDAAFWDAHARWSAIRATWNADKDPDEDAVYERYNQPETDAFHAMICIPVHTAAAILAKHKAAHYDMTAPDCSTLRFIEDDLARLAA